MSKSWAEIERFYSDLIPQLRGDPFCEAMAAIKKLVSNITAGSLAQSLFGWVSMHDLCIQQTDIEPRSGPFLRISPKLDGTVEFRYHDTAIETRQWSRSVPPERVIGRFEAFLDQLHWVSQ